MEYATGKYLRNIRKIKLILPADCHTTVLLVSSLHFSQPTQGQGWFLGDVKRSNGGFWHWQVSGLPISNVAAVQIFIVFILLHFSP